MKTIRPIKLTTDDSEWIVDNSILSAVAKCDTFAALRYGLGMAPKDEAVELKCGSAVHEALAVWIVSGGNVKKAMARLDDAYYAWAERNKIDATHRLAPGNVERILELWLNANPLDEWPMVVKPAHVEVGLDATLTTIDDRPVRFVTLLDAIGVRRVGGGLWGIDHKTGKGLTEWWKHRQQDAAQFTGQVWLARANGLDDLLGVVANGIELAEPRTSARKCPDHGVPYYECSPKHARAELVFVTRGESEIASWEKTAISLARRYVKMRARIETIRDVTREKQQGRFNDGCSFCSAREWCRLGRPVHGLTKGENAWGENRWNPLEHVQKRGGVRDGVVA